MCWHNGNGGKVIQLAARTNGHTNGKNLNGSDTYTGTAHKPKAGGKVYAAAAEAIKASIWNAPGAVQANVWDISPTFKTARFDTPDGKKHLRPVHAVPGGWKIGDPPGLLPLYGINELPAHAQIVFVPEGEKCRDLVCSLGLAAVASTHGAVAAAKTDWAPLANSGKLIVFLPDADEPGEKYVTEATALILEIKPDAQIKVVRLPDLPEAGDIEQYIEARDSLDTEAIAGSILDLVKAAPLVTGDPKLAAMGVVDLLRDFPEMRPPLIQGILRMTETANMIDAAKGGKTHTAIDLNLSVATGRAWLGKYEIENPGPVLYIDAELHPQTMARRIASICSARGIYSGEIAGKLDVLSLRGRLKNIFELRVWLAANVKPGQYRLITFDALYRLIPEGIDENSNSDMTQVFNAVDQIGDSTGAAVLIIHHASKGVQAGKSVVDVGSGASAMARATDSHIIFRQHAEDGCKVMEMAGRSWPPIAPVPMRFTYPVWNIDDTLDPEDLRETGRRKRKEQTPDDSTPAAAPVEPWTAQRFVETFATDTDQPKALIAAKARQAGLGIRAVDDLIRLATATGLLHRWYRPKSNEIRLATSPQPITETGATK